jgi:sigma-B regulation protein RsbU (phosphoserine phosphatase)
MVAAFADTAQKSNPKGVPVAFGYIPLQSVGTDLAGSLITVTTADGRVLFDTDLSTVYSKKNFETDPLFMSAQRSQVTTGAGENDIDGVRYLGSYFKPGYDLVVLTKTPWRKAMRATYSLVEQFILLGIMSISLAMIFGLVFSNRLTAPLNQLYAATKEVAAGNFSLKLQSTSRDEIGALSSSFNVMSDKIEHLIKEQVEKTRLEGELKIASTVQQTLIPPEKFDNEKIFIRSHYESASECGGD